MKDVPIGNDDFKDLRNNEGYYVDKSNLIQEILSKKNTKVFLFTRPRRFGKTLNMSMIDAFFNMKYKGNDWFEGLNISCSKELMDVRNTCPVISMDLKGLNLVDMQSFLDSFSIKIRDLCIGHGYLADSDLDPELLREFEKIKKRQGSRSDLEGSLRLLTKLLKSHHGKDAIILIDEYDNPINSSYGLDIQKDIISFMRNLLTNALKGNDSLRFGVITGVMQIAKESIFSGLNNLYVNNVLSTDFDEEYGFTESEVKEMLSYFGHPERFDEVRDWYDGYRFGNAEIYNPWSLLNYIAQNFRPAAYWAGTSGNDILDALIDNADDDVWQELIELGNGNTVTKQIKTTVTMDDITKGGNAIYSVLVMSGYLNAIENDGLYELSIPNNEMRSVYLMSCPTGWPKAPGSISEGSSKP